MCIHMSAFGYSLFYDNNTRFMLNFTIQLELVWVYIALVVASAICLCRRHGMDDTSGSSPGKLSSTLKLISDASALMVWATPAAYRFSCSYLPMFESALPQHRVLRWRTKYDFESTGISCQTIPRSCMSSIVFENVENVCLFVLIAWNNFSMYQTFIRYSGQTWKR